MSDAPVPTVVAVRDGGVLTLTLSNPGRRNALTWGMYAELRSACESAVDDAALRAVVVRGTQADGFAAGTDIGQFGGFDGEAGLAYERRTGEVLGALRAIPVPTIALVGGAAVGAGLAIAASCDLVVAERGAVFGAPIARTLGNCLPASVVARLVHRLGASRVTAMLLAAELVPAETVAENGFVHRLVEPGGLDDACAALLTGISRSAPLTLRALKETLRRVEVAVPALDNEDLLALCYGSRDFAEGVDAFVHRRHPVWEGA